MKAIAKIRFAHTDSAGIVFFPRYFEMISRYFPEAVDRRKPFSMQTQFLLPNRLGDSLSFDLLGSTNDCRVTAMLQGNKSFESSIKALPVAHRPSIRPAFEGSAVCNGPERLGAWAADSSGQLQLSRYYEWINESLEIWFETILGISFGVLVKERQIGVPSARFDTQWFKSPVEGDEIRMLTAPCRLGRTSIVFQSQMVCGDTVLVQSEQTVVAVKFEGSRYLPLRVPDDFRQRIEACLPGQGVA